MSRDYSWHVGNQATVLPYSASQPLVNLGERHTRRCLRHADHAHRYSQGLLEHRERATYFSPDLQMLPK